MQQPSQSVNPLARGRRFGFGTGARGEAAVWTPADLSPLVWLDATQLGLGDGASVSSFTDRSGNGNHFVQANGTKQPVYRASGINGLGAVEGDGVDDFLLLASVPAAADWWQLTVGQLVSFGSAANAWSVDDYDPDGGYILMQLNGTNALDVQESSGAFATGSLPVGTGTPRAYLFTGGSDGTSAVADDGTERTAGSPLAKVTAPMRLFGRGDGLAANYRIGEFLYGEGVLTPEQRAALWAYVSAKWGTGVGL